MDKIRNIPDGPILDSGRISEKFRNLNILTFHKAYEYIHELPYGYNSDSDDPMILFKEKKGTCITKHSVIASLAQEQGLLVEKHIGIYAMTERIVSGTNVILEKYKLPFIPMTHCFLVYKDFKVDLTEGNNNGKNQAIEQFLFTQKVAPCITSKEEYLLYRNFLKDILLVSDGFSGIKINTILNAREEGLKLLKASVSS